MIGFVGLGNVGAPMAQNLLAAGLEVVGFDLRESPAFVTAGGKFTSNLDELISCSEVLLCSLPSGDAVTSVVERIEAANAKPRVVADLSSYALEKKSDNATRLRRAGVEMLDCEVSGLPPQVISRQAVIFKSGNSDAIASMDQVFDGIADTHFDLGEFGSATKLKLIANTMVCVHNLMAAEALVLGQEAGLSAEQIVEVLSPSAAGSPTFRFKAPLMLSREFESGIGPFRHMFGYLKRTSDLAQSAGVRSQLLEVAQRVYSVAEAEGRHDQDIAAIIEVVEKQGVEHV